MQRWVSERFADEDSLDFYGVNIGEDAQYVRGYVEQMGIPIPIVMGSDALINSYRLPGGLSPYPVDYVIDRKGRVAYANHEYDPELIIQTIERLLESGGGEDTTGFGGNHQAGLPVQQALLSINPNPTNAEVTILFSVPQASPVKLQALDLKGRLVENLYSGTQSDGEHRISWNAHRQAAGIYLIRLETGTETLTEKALILK